MKIGILGAGYVGLVTGACFAELDHDVSCLDVDPKKVDLINSGESPIYEPKLGGLLKKHSGGTLNAFNDAAEALPGSEAVFVCVGTPSGKDGSTDLSYVENAARMLGKALSETKGCTVVVKSTVPPGTTMKVADLVRESGAQDFTVAMNPEFLREGSAVDDFMNPDRIVIGTEDALARKKMKDLYSFTTAPIVQVDLKTAEMIKYSSNAFLACKISFMNELGNICKKLRIDIYEVLEGMKYDPRIGGKHMSAGAGYGGSCFPKDVASLINFSRRSGVEPVLLNAVRKINDAQPLKMLELAEKHFPLSGKKAAVLGLAFKPDTDDMREAPSLKLIDALIAKGAEIAVYDPKAMGNARKILGDSVNYAQSAKEALGGADVCFIMTEWEEFRDPTLYSGILVIDGRKTVHLEENYEGVCW